MQDINEGFAQLSEQLMLVAGMAYAVAFCAYVWDLFTFSKAAKAGLATEESTLQASVLAGANARGATGQVITSSTVCFRPSTRTCGARRELPRPGPEFAERRSCMP